MYTYTLTDYHKFIYYPYVYGPIPQLYGNTSQAVKTAIYQELKSTDTPATLIEIAFHDNEDDVDWMLNNMSAIAKAIYKGIINYI